MKIQNIIFPVHDFPEKEMFLRSTENDTLDSTGVLIKKGSVLTSDTYFNMFHIFEWERITGHNSYSLTLNLKGKLKLDLYGYNSEKPVKKSTNKPHTYLLESKIINNTQVSPVVFNFKGSKEFQFVYFKITALESSVKFEKGWFSTVTDMEYNEVKLALIFCTYKREDYLYSNVNEINKYIKTHEELKNNIDLYVIDNGNSIDPKKINHKGVTVFTNKNTGGSGGFCRGIIEVLKSKENFSHVLLMDDDVEVSGESFFRTFSLLALKKQEFTDYFINGAMFRLDKKNINFENLADWRNYYFKPLNSNIDMNQINNIWFYNYQGNYQNLYSGWWYCCIPLHLIHENNLPFPFFIRKDDVEYALRHAAKFLNLNGICIWHEAFDKKKNPVIDYYLDLRNDLILNALLASPGKSFLFNVMLSVRFFIKLIFQYDYTNYRIIWRAVSDFLTGPEILLQDQREIIIEINKLKEKPVKLQPDTADGFRNLNKASLKKPGILKKLLIIISFNGHLFPKVFFKNKGFAVYGQGREYSTWFMVREVLFVDEENLMAFNRIISLKQFLKVLFSFLAIMVNYFRKHRKIARKYKTKYPEFIGIEFWEKYLEE